MEDITGLLQAISFQRIAVTDAGRIAADANAQLVHERNYLAELEERAANVYRASGRYTDGQKAECRRAILALTETPRNIGSLCESLPGLERGLIEREVGYLCERKALTWNGGRGPASMYHR